VQESVENSACSKIAKPDPSGSEKVDAAGPGTYRSGANVEFLERAVRFRFEEDIDAAVRRRSPGESKLAGALRAVAPLSPALRASLGEATSVLVDRGALDRHLCVCGLRSLSEAHDRQVGSLLLRALAAGETGGSAALSAACSSRDLEIGERLAELASSRPSHVAFGAELARVVRGESDGRLLAELAPRIKESHRIAICSEMIVPLVRAENVPPAVIPAFALLRSAERHLGRWLVLAEAAVRAGDRSVVKDARERAQIGSDGSRAAWTLVAWAIEDAHAAAQSKARISVPVVRLTVEMVARLSDRPSAERDMEFLFRIAAATPSRALGLLEILSRATPLSDELAIRSALYLARDHGRTDLGEFLATFAESGRREELWGLAAAAWWDTCATSDDASANRSRERIHSLAERLLTSKFLTNRAWGALILSARKGAMREQSLVTQSSVRWIQSGRLE
jgi:hypothetical protein